MIPNHPCSALCTNGTHVDLIYCTASILDCADPHAFIARQWEHRYRVRVLDVLPALEAPRPGEMPDNPTMTAVPVYGDGWGATEPYAIRWEER